MASVRRVGPGLPSGVRRPDRSVSLRDVNELPVQKMGGLEEFLFWSRENPRPYGMSSEPRDVSKLSARARAWVESMGFDVEDLHEPMADDLEDLAEAEIDERDTGEVFDERQQAGMDRDYQRILDDRQQQVDDVANVAAAWQDAEKDASVGDPEWDGFPVEESSRLSEEVRRLVGQPGGFAPSPPLSGMLPGAPLGSPQGQMLMTGAGQQALPGMEPRPSWSPTDEQRATGKEWIPKVRKTLAGTQPPETEDDLNPQSQRSQQLLADLFAQQQRTRSQQSQQGYFGGLGKAVGGMSTEQKIALALLAGAVTGGMSTPMMVPALGLGAGLAIR